MVYGNPPIHSLPVHQALQMLANPNLRVECGPISGKPVPATLVDVINSCLQKNPTLRPTTEQLLCHPFLHPLCPVQLSSTSSSNAVLTRTPNVNQPSSQSASHNSNSHVKST